MSEVIEDGVVSICNPRDIVVVWKDIPGFSKYEACNLGLIRHKRLGGISNLYEAETTKGTYLRVSALDDAGKCRSKEVHHLVCLAFHGVPDETNVKMEVNHKDGNKHNNLPSNIEWMSRGDNLLHAYKEGLRTDCRRVIIHDHLHDRLVEVHSISEVGRQMNVSKSEAWRVICDHKTKKYLDRFTFTFVEGKTTTRKANHVRDIKAFDYSENRLLVSDNLGTMELLTGVKRATIAWQLKSSNPRLIKGFWFKYMDDRSPFPTFTEEEIEISKIRITNNGNPIRVTDTKLNTTKLFSGIHQFAVTIGEHPNTIRRALKKGSGKSYLQYLIEFL